MIAVAAVKEIDVIAEILLPAQRHAELTIERQIALSGDVVAARHALLLGVAAVLPAAYRVIVVGGEAQILVPGFSAERGALLADIEAAIEKGVIAQ